MVKHIHKRSSIGTGKALTPATVHRLAKWHTQPMSNTADLFSLILVTTEFLFPTIVLQLSLMKATTFFQGIPFASNVAFNWSNMDCAVPILQIGMSRNPVTALSLISSKYLTTIATVFCWLVSLHSSHRNEKGPVLHCFTSSSSKAGAMAFLTIIVVLVRPQVNFLAIFESGNICLHRRVKWSATAIGKLCSTTQFVNRVSLRITSSVSAFIVKKRSSQELWCSAISAAGCVVSMILSHTLCKRHARYLVDFYIPTGTLPSIYLDTCMYIFISTLMVPSSFLPW